MAIKTALYDPVPDGNYSASGKSTSAYKVETQGNEFECYTFRQQAGCIRSRIEALDGLVFCETMSVTVTIAKGRASVQGEIISRNLLSHTIAQHVATTVQNGAIKLAAEHPLSKVEMRVELDRIVRRTKS